jgi:hypothetical protein
MPQYIASVVSADAENTRPLCVPVYSQPMRGRHPSGVEVKVREEPRWAIAAIGVFLFFGAVMASHEARTDVSMLLGLIFLLLVGGGSLALDVWLASRRLDRNA